MEMMKVLLAEDDLDDQAFFRHYLKNRHDMTIVGVVNNGEEMLDYLSNANDLSLPDFIVLDQNMPRMNGLQALQAIKQNSRFRHITTMIYSTYADKELIATATRYGADIVYTKPETERGYHALVNDLVNAARH